MVRIAGFLRHGRHCSAFWKPQRNLQLSSRHEMLFDEGTSGLSSSRLGLRDGAAGGETVRWLMSHARLDPRPRLPRCLQNRFRKLIPGVEADLAINSALTGR